jgi:hypothetical protein
MERTLHGKLVMESYISEVVTIGEFKSGKIMWHLRTIIVLLSIFDSIGQCLKSKTWFWQSIMLTEPGAKWGALVPLGHTSGSEGSTVTNCKQLEES